MKINLKLFLLLATFVITSTQLNAADLGTFESFYSAGGLGFWGWTAIIVGTVAVGVATFMTFGGTAAAAPAWMATVGSWIGSSVGLSGAAAANFGLALLGGGAVAAGGLGIAGGVTVLAVIFEIGVSAATYGVDVAMEKWQHQKFIEANKNMLTLTIPRNTSGGRGYKKAVAYLQKNYNPKKDIKDEANQQVLRKAIDVLSSNIRPDSNAQNTIKDLTLLALLHLQTNNYNKASISAKEALDIAEQRNSKRTLPSFIWALAELANPEKVCTEETIQALRVAFYHEPSNQFIPIMTAACLDRLMYRYHYGQLDIAHLKSFLAIITNKQLDKKVAAPALEIFVTRSLIELKRTQQDFHVVMSDKTFIQDKNVINELQQRLVRHEDLVLLQKNNALSKVDSLAKYLPKESKVTTKKLTTLLDAYINDIQKTKQQLELIEKEFLDETSKSGFFTYLFTLIAIATLGGIISIVWYRKKKREEL